MLRTLFYLNHLFRGPNPKSQAHSEVLGLGAEFGNTVQPVTHSRP